MKYIDHLQICYCFWWKVTQHPFRFIVKLNMNTISNILKILLTLYRPLGQKVLSTFDLNSLTMKQTTEQEIYSQYL